MACRPEAGTAKAQVVLIFSLASPKRTEPRAAFLIHHPERRSLLPRLHPLNWHRLDGLTRFGVIRVRDDVLILGGFDARRNKYKRQVLRYDLRRGRTYVCNKMVTPRADFTPFLMDGRVYCVGGRSRDGQLTRAAEYFEPMMGRWYNDTPLPVGCADYGVTTTDKDVILVGGHVPGDRAQQIPSSHVWKMTKEFATVDKIEELVSVWTSIPDAMYPSSHGVYKHRCVFVPDYRRVYVVGGVRDGVPHPRTSENGPACVEGREVQTSDSGLYYLDLDNLEQKKSKDPFGRRIYWQKRYIDECRRVGPGVCAIGRRIFVVGGCTDCSEGPDSTVGCYDWRTKRWISMFSLNADGIDLSEVVCVQLEPNILMKEFDFDRQDWMLQWALW